MPKKLSKQQQQQSQPPPSATLSTAADDDDTGSLPAFLASPTAAAPLPALIVFDLDYTLWPFWVDTHVSPPLKPRGGGGALCSAATDRSGESFAFYDDVPSVLAALPRAGVRVAVASRTSAPGLARDLLRMLYVPDAADGGKAATRRGGRRAVDAFDGGLEMYPGSKVRHMEAIQKRTGVDLRDVLFFDDEARNRDTEALGVTMWLVRDGLSWDEVEKGVEEWRRRRGHGAG